MVGEEGGGKENRENESGKEEKTDGIGGGGKREGSGCRMEVSKSIPGNSRSPGKPTNQYSTN